MDIELYRKQVEEMQNLRNKLSEIQKELSLNVKSKSEEMRLSLQDLLLNLFTKESLGITSNFVLSYWPDTRFKEKDNEISTWFDVGNYLATLYKSKFGKQINRRYKSDLKITVKYHILKDNFSMTLYQDFGDQFINNNKILDQANRELCWDIGKVIRVENIQFEEVLTKIEKIKYMIDNYEAYYIANVLVESK